MTSLTQLSIHYADYVTKADFLNVQTLQTTRNAIALQHLWNPPNVGINLRLQFSNAGSRSTLVNSCLSQAPFNKEVFNLLVESGADVTTRRYFSRGFPEQFYCSLPDCCSWFANS